MQGDGALILTDDFSAEFGLMEIDTFRKKFYNIEYHSDKGNVCEDIDDQNLREIKA